MNLDSLVFVTWKDTCCPAAPLWPLTSVWRKITRRGSSPWEFKLYAEWYNILLKVLIVKLKKKKKNRLTFFVLTVKGSRSDCEGGVMTSVYSGGQQRSSICLFSSLWWQHLMASDERHDQGCFQEGIKQGEIMLLLSHQALRMTAFYKRAIHCWKHDSSR